MTLHACIGPASSNPLASFLRKPRGVSLLVPWAFSYPGDLDFDAFGRWPSASRGNLGSNQLAAVIVATVGSVVGSAGTGTASSWVPSARRWGSGFGSG